MRSVSFLLLVAVTVAGSDIPATAPDFDKPRIIETGASAPDSRTLRIATWNIDRGTELPALTSALRSNPVDLLLLQEVDLDAARSGHKDEALELSQSLHLHGAYAIEFEELSQEQGHPAYIGQATLTNLPVRGERVLRFQHQSGFWKPRSWLPSSVPLMQRRLGSRIALVTELTFAGHLLIVYNAHLESRSYGRIQAEQLDEILTDSTHYLPGTAFILGGDLNTKYFPSVFLKKLEKSGFESSMGNKIERTHTIAMALDWIFVKGTIAVSAGKVRKDLKGSDHYALYAKIEAR